MSIDITKAKPILFNTKMAKAVLDGKKTQTRRVLGDRFRITEFIPFDEKENSKYDTASLNFFVAMGFSKYKAGDILWVREPVKIIEYTPVGNYGGSWNDCDSARYEYLSDREIGTLLEIPERFNVIPKWIKNCKGVPNGCIKEMARIFLKVTKVKIERLQDITYEDISKEGCPYTSIEDALEVKAIGVKSKAFEWWINLWNATAKDGYKWKDNPYVFVYEFERV